MSDLTCPRCAGKGESFAFIDGDGWGTSGWVPCSTCNGTGRITPEHAVRMERGEKIRQARLGRDESLRECAKRLGVSATRLSRIEHGAEEPSETEMAALTRSPLSAQHPNLNEGDGHGP